MKLPKFCQSADAADFVKQLGEQFAVVKNPSYVHPAYELYPLAPPVETPLKKLSAIVCDMDGTTTTTEPLCLHSLEYMVRRINAWPSEKDWEGLDPVIDHPHVIGNSTTRHVEYLIQTYGDRLDKNAYLTALIEGTGWTMALGKDPNRRQEARLSALHLGLGEVWERGEGAELLGREAVTLEQIAEFAAAQATRRRESFETGSQSDIVRGAIEIYYARYHQILEGINAGRGEELSQQLLGGGHLIEPMPGIPFFLALIRGYLRAEEAGVIYDARAADQLKQKHVMPAQRTPESLAEKKAGFLKAVQRLIESPLKIAIVTSSIRYEADIVLKALFEVIHSEMEQWPIDASRRRAVADQMADPQSYYDAIITASDSSEIRLKPHRDLYSLALHQLGLSPARFNEVIGLEDSESGVTAIRAAGVGLSVAVPFEETAGHDLGAATRILNGGLPELMYLNHFFLD